MAGGSFLARSISYVVNEIVVEGLANNSSFQRFAVRTSNALEGVSTKDMKNSKLAQVPISSPSTSPGRTTLWSISFILFGLFTLVAFLFASIISKFLAPFQNPFLNAIQNDRYYCILAPLTVPILFVAVYFHWLSMKLFKHA